MNLIFAGPATSARIATARVIAEMARRKYGALHTEIVALDPDGLALIAESQGPEWIGLLQTTQALLNGDANRVFVLDDEGLGRFVGTFPTFDLSRIHNLELGALAGFRGDTNHPEYFIEVFDALAPALIRHFSPGRIGASEVRGESDALWYYIFSAVFD